MARLGVWLQLLPPDMSPSCHPRPSSKQPRGTSAQPFSCPARPFRLGSTPPETCGPPGPTLLQPAACKRFPAADLGDFCPTVGPLCSVVPSRGTGKNYIGVTVEKLSDLVATFSAH